MGKRGLRVRMKIKPSVAAGIGFKRALGILALLSLPLCSAFAAGDPCEQFSAPAQQLGQAPQKTPQDGFHYTSDCARGQNWARVERSPEMQRLLRGLGKMVGQDLPVYSCFRSQQSQDAILCHNHCAPRFGNVECSGRIAANVSEHTIGVAADIILKTAQGPQSPKQQLRAEIFRLCGVLDANRKQNNSGWGGITVYGIDPGTGNSYMHMDIKRDWCNWGECENSPQLGEGHCKRTKYQNTEAKLMQQQADAQKAKDLVAVQRLDELLKKLHADCPPGDLSCRDLYKTL